LGYDHVEEVEYFHGRNGRGRAARRL